MEVPRELIALPQWINWQLTDDGRKLPIDPRTARPAKTNDPATWCDFDTAFRGPYSLGFVFTANDPFFGLDLDGCRNPETGEIAEWAECVLSELPTYAEVSPSGCGVKVYGIGKVPSQTGKKKSLGDEPQVSDKPPAIEVYDWGRYFAFTGERIASHPLAVVDCQAALDRLCSHFWPPEAATVPAVPSAAISHVPGPNGSDIANRAAKYLDRLPPAVSGQGGHNQTFRAACVLVLGFGLSPEHAFPLLQAWNAGCQPPWKDKDLWHKLFDADKREGRRGWLLDGRGYEGPDVDLRALLTTMAASRPEEQATSLSPAAGEFPADCLRVPGLIGEIIDWNLRTALYPQPELALAGALALLATITGRKVTDDRGTRTNCYVLGLAPSGAGKEHARKANKEILLRAGGEQHIGPERIASSAGLVSSVAAAPAILFQLDEIGRLLATMKNPAKSPHLYNVGTVLMQLYSASDSLWIADAYADAKKTKRINQPHAVIYGTAVPTGFWENLTTENVSEGLLGRLMTFESTLGYVPIVKPQPESVPAKIVDQVRTWLEFIPGGPVLGNLVNENPVPAVVPYEPRAQQRMGEHLAAICERRVKEDATTAAVWSRSGEKTAKLALLFACSRCGPYEALVTFDDVDRAVKVANWLTRKMLQKTAEHVAENETESRSKKLLRLIEGEMPMSILTRRTQWLRGKERKEMLDDLISSGLVVVETKESTGGRPATYFRRAT